MAARFNVCLLVCAGLSFVGCDGDGRPRPAVGDVARATGTAEALMLPAAMDSPAMRRSRAVTGFARLPDRGDLIAYPAQRAVRRNGAYTWHRAEVSEAHALASIVDGSLRVNTPAGEMLDFVYEHHEEHSDGAWTWVGRLNHHGAGERAVLTFGSKAAFGTIARPGREPFRLTTRDGVAWMIETDPARVADIRNCAMCTDDPNHLLLPNHAADRKVAASGSAMVSAVPAVVAPGTSSVSGIDLVLGYTPGFASMYGGDSQAVTRLNHLVAVTNEAYTRSHAAGHVRLVHAMQVNYSDGSDNSDTLEKLTGYRSGIGWISPDPAFVALRAARDRYGADLVSLVRKLELPESGGCGITWRLGGGSRVGANDEPFGYSVVSDGQDQTTNGKTHFCRDETLAHEIGHALGLERDKAVSAQDGEAGQGAYLYPSKHNTGMAFGTSASAWSAVARFRTGAGAKRRARYDIDGDGRSDMLWFRPHDARLAYWIMDGPVITRHGAAMVGLDATGSPSFVFELSGDFNGDGRVDLLWRRSMTNEFHYWSGDGGAFASREFFTQRGYPWRLVGAGDIDGDGKDDLVWRDVSDTPKLEYWIMDGPSVRHRETIGLHLNWWIEAMGDFNGDNRLDLIWSRHWGDMQYWAGDGAQFADRRYFANQPEGSKWAMRARDVDGDGKDDLIWFNEREGQLAYWVMDGAIVRRHSGVSLGRTSNMAANWSVQSLADYSGDGRVDIIWNRGWGDMQFWIGDDGAYASRQFFAHFPSGWVQL